MATRAPCFERLLVIHDAVGRAGPVNMALDEVLLDPTTDAAVLRIYCWSEPTVSFGYFEPAAAARRVARGRPVVRRWTGGGIVEHGEDLTYSLCIPRACGFAAYRGAESYRRVHAAVASALEQSGVLAKSHGLAPPSPLGNTPANECFERPVPYDLLAGGRKIAGGAQRRTRAGVLHQGSIRVDVRKRGDLEAWKTALSAALPIALADHCAPRPVSYAEFAAADALAATKYATAAWTDRI